MIMLSRLTVQAKISAQGLLPFRTNASACLGFSRRSPSATSPLSGTPVNGQDARNLETHQALHGQMGPLTMQHPYSGGFAQPHTCLTIFIFSAPGASNSKSPSYGTDLRAVVNCKLSTVPSCSENWITDMDIAVKTPHAVHLS